MPRQRHAFLNAANLVRPSLCVPAVRRLNIGHVMLSFLLLFCTDTFVSRTGLFRAVLLC